VEASGVTEGRTSARGEARGPDGKTPTAEHIEQLDKIEPSEEAKAHDPSPVDAMGQDKRRPIVGHTSGPSRRSQLLFFGSVVAIAVILIGGWLLAVATLDQPPDSYPDRAVWSEDAGERNLPPRDPSQPCGEPGNPQVPAADSPCAPGATVRGTAPGGAGSASDASASAD